MAERRMFAKTIINSDAFLDMPLSAQALYFHLSMRADDDGFINNPKRVMRLIGANDDDFKLLIAKQFVIPFESGIVVIKHWKIHNYIQKDRYKPTIYNEERADLTMDNGVYTRCIHNASRMDTQVRLELELGKVRDRLVCCGGSENFSTSDVEKSVENQTTDNTKTFGKYKNVFLTSEQYSELCNIYGESAIDDYTDRISCYINDNNKRPYKNHYKTVKSWLTKDHVQPLPEKPSYDLEALMEHAKNTPLIKEQTNEEN